MNVLYEIPVNVILVDDPSGTYTTNRTKKEIDEIFPNVNQIWESAQIRFEINKIQRKTIESNEIELLFDWNKINDPPSNDILITTYFVNHMRNLNNGRFPNGRARRKSRRTFIIDRTRVNDFRTTAHEFGHVLGLDHIIPNVEDRLMAQGVNGEHLIQSEIDISRRNIQPFLQ